MKRYPGRYRLSVSVLILALVLSGTACGGNAIRSFRAALAASGPLVNSLVSSRALPEAKAAAIIRDFDDGATCALTLQNDFNAIPKDDPNARRLKLTAAVKAMRCWRAIVDRQDFAAHPRVKMAADIADGMLSSIVVFYSDPGEIRNEVGRPDTINAQNEGDLENQLKAKVEELKRALKP